jgi:tetratricopeptide (TPR) repeat protein
MSGGFAALGLAFKNEVQDINRSSIRMHRSGIFLIALGASLVLLGSAWSEDSSDLFLNAYKDFQAAEKLEREAKPQEALQKYRSAQQILAKIRKASSDWQPLVVDYRLRKTQESIERLETGIGILPAILPIPEAPEGNLPEPEKERPLPTISTQPPVVTFRPPSSQKRMAREPARAPAQGSDPPVNRGVTAADRELRELRRELRQARAENKELNERLMKKSAELQSALVEVDKTKVNVVELKSQVAQTSASLENARKDGTSVSGIRAEFERKYAEVVEQASGVQADNEVLEEENERLLAKLEAAAKYISESDTIRSRLLVERKQLADERSKAVAKVKKIKDNTSEIERVAGENRRLKSELAQISEKMVSKSEFEKLAAEKKVLTAKLSEKVPSGTLAEKDDAIAALQSDLNSANDKLLQAQARITRSDDQLTVLRKQLDETSGRLAHFELNGVDEKKLAMENELLRGIILRQIREQTRRDDAKKLLEQEIGTLKLNSDVLRQQLAVLSAPVLELTPEERSLFKEPVVLLTEPSVQSLEVTVAVSKPSAEEVKAGKFLQEPAGPESLPEDIRELIERAKTMFEVKNYTDAENLYLQVVAKMPNSYFALSNLGAVQIEGGKLSAAEVALKKAIEIDDSESYAYTNLGIVFSRQGKFGEAIEALQKAVILNDEDAVAHNYLGVCLGQKEVWNESETHLKKAIDLRPEYPDAHFNLAVLYATTQPPSLERAKEHYVKATALGAAPDASLERLIQ